jgi:hypothetical protein
MEHDDVTPGVVKGVDSGSKSAAENREDLTSIAYIDASSEESMAGKGV